MANDDAVKPLSHVRPGVTATVIGLLGGRGFQSRLVNMGLNVGVEVRVLHGGNGDGPALVATGQTRLALGRGMAHRVMVAVDPD